MHWSLEWQASDCCPNTSRKNTTSKEQNEEKELCRVTGEVRQGGCTEKYLKAGKRKKKGKTNQKTAKRCVKHWKVMFPFNTLHLLLVNWIAPGIHQRRAGGWGGEGCTAETGHGRVPPNWRNIRELQAQTHHSSWAAAGAHSGWEWLSAGTAQRTERLFHHHSPSQWANFHTNHHKPIWGQKYSSVCADTAGYYQCPTLLIIHTLTSSVIKHHPLWNLVFPLHTGKIFKSRFILLHRESACRERQ